MALLTVLHILEAVRIMFSWKCHKLIHLPEARSSRYNVTFNIHEYNKVTDKSDLKMSVIKLRSEWPTINNVNTGLVLIPSLHWFQCDITVRYWTFITLCGKSQAVHSFCMVSQHKVIWYWPNSYTTCTYIWTYGSD